MKQPLYLLLAFCLLAVSCERKGKPQPRICAESAITQGDLVTMKLLDTLVLVNCSERFTNQRWVLPNGGGSTLEKIYFIPNTLDTATVNLFVTNDKFVNEYQASIRVAVYP